MSTHDTEQGEFDALTAWVVPFDEDAIRADYARRDSFMEDCTYEEFRGAWIEFRGDQLRYLASLRNDDIPDDFRKAVEVASPIGQAMLIAMRDGGPMTEEELFSAAQELLHAQGIEPVETI